MLGPQPDAYQPAGSSVDRLTKLASDVLRQPRHPGEHCLQPIPGIGHRPVRGVDDDLVAVSGGLREVLLQQRLRAL